MTATDHLRKGWCPGALRPMLSGDGLLLRVRPRAGAFSIPALSAIADAASRFGSGEIDLTNRANLQLRGISDVTYPYALAALDAAGLIDAEAGAEAVRNVVVDPLSGLDPTGADMRTLAAELEDRLVGDQRFWSLPGKFGFSLSGSVEPRVGSRSTDVMLAAATNGIVALYLGGDLATCALVPRENAVAAMLSVASVFVEFSSADPSVRRMHNLVGRRGSAAIFYRARLAASPAMISTERTAHSVGCHARDGQIFAAGIGLPFGRIRATELDALCEASSRLGLETVHTSPERVLVHAVGDAAAATALLAEAAALGLITTPGDPRLNMDVCPGAPACRNTANATRQDAQHLVASLNGTLAGVSMHILGCAKGCARHGAADITLVGRNGLYDIVRSGAPDGAVALAAVPPSDIAAAIGRLIAERPQ